MKFRDALIQMQMILERDFGVKEGVVKIALTPEAMDRVVGDEIKKNDYRIRASDLGEYFLCGIQLVPRVKDRF